MESKHYYDEGSLIDLNEEQREAVTSTEGMIRVIAGAGSGKTRALTERFAYLVNEGGVLPGNILCVTFTNKAANEMRARINRLTGDNDTGYINTFHGFCVSVLQEDGYVVSYPKNILVLDNSDIDIMLQTIYDERGLSMRDMKFSDARDMIEMIKLVERPDYYLDMVDEPLEVLYEKYMKAQKSKDIIFYGYLYQEKKCFGLDYNDLLKFTLHIFSLNEEVKLKWQKRLNYIMVDEFQDIDEIQYELMEVLRGYHNNLFVVGDPDQTIYSWRGANGKYLMDFDRTHDEVKTIFMMKNYRSTPQILEAANSLVAKNKNRIKKDLIPALTVDDHVSESIENSTTESENPASGSEDHPAKSEDENITGGKPVCHLADDQEAEAKYIADRIKELNESGADYRDIAILYRAHYLTRSVEEQLIKEKIPYKVYSGVQFFARKEVKDALAYLRMIVYKDDLSFKRICNVPKRNLGKRRIEFLTEYAERYGTTLYEALKENLEAKEIKGTKADEFMRLIEEYAEKAEGKQASDVLSSILDDSGYENMLRTEGAQDRLDNLAELKQSVYDHEATCGEETEISHYLSHVALFSNSDAEDHEDKVKLMTVHAAKGLEFPYVILCGMNEGIFPSRKIQTLEGMEEERRLAFVAVTRAEKKLFFTMSEGMGIDGAPKYPSRFVLDIDQELLEFTRNFPEQMEAAARSNIAMKERILRAESGDDLFEPGDRVRGPVFGAGTILDVDKQNKKYVIHFDDIETEREITFRAKLEKID